MRRRRTMYLTDYVANQYPIEKYKELIFITLDLVENFLLTLKNGVNYNSTSIASYEKKYGSSQMNTNSKIESIVIKNIDNEEKMKKFLHSYFASLNALNQEEIEKIVNALDDETDIEIRNKAMCLLTIRLGIRFIDVKNLKFENIDWKNNEIKFYQEKTNVYLKLPLPEEVGSAIIKYIKGFRPKSIEKYIFITHDETVSKLSDSFNLREYLFNAYTKAGIDYLSKSKKGIHNFRHALATNKLKNGVPSDIISSILGHVDKNSIKTYVNLDDENVKEMGK